MCWAPGERIQRDFGLPNLIRFPIVPDLSAAGDGATRASLRLPATAPLTAPGPSLAPTAAAMWVAAGTDAHPGSAMLTAPTGRRVPGDVSCAGGQPLVVSQPASSTAAAFMELGAAVVREVAKMGAPAGIMEAAGPRRRRVAYDPDQVRVHSWIGARRGWLPCGSRVRRPSCGAMWVVAGRFLRGAVSACTLHAGFLARQCSSHGALCAPKSTGDMCMSLQGLTLP